jgi:hypothetical protein
MKQKLIDYHRKYASKYIPAEGIRLAEIIPQCDEYFYSEKLDGHLFFANNDGKEIKFYNKSGIEFSMPALNSLFPQEAIGLWAGELYIFGNERSRPFLVSKAISNGSDDLAFAVFDSVNDERKSLQERFIEICKYFPESGKIHRINLERTETRSQITNEYNELISKGREGMVIHTPQGHTYKVKPQISIDCVVLGYAIRENGNQIRELLVGIVVEDGYMVIGKIGTGFSEIEREEWVRNLQPLIINSNCIEIAGNGLAFYWVKPELVIEVKCLELLIENSEGTIYKQKVKFINEIGYSQAGKITGVSLMSPIYEGIRTDKKADLFDAGLSQLTSRIEIEVNESNFKERQASEIVRREVYKKDGKNGTALRKIISWKTNKEITGLFPAYILYYTDFSPGRKDPLQTDIYTAIDEVELELKFDDLLAENIKKGWEKIK